jgi:imidazolonepropionase-like amidohydrolase
LGGAHARAESEAGGGTKTVTTIVNARVFDGRWVLNADSVAVHDDRIAAVGRKLAPEGTVVDAKGGTLLPGFIDAHTHTGMQEQALRTALLFGVTTELEMGAEWSRDARRAALANSQLADFRTTPRGMSPTGGHPSELFTPPGATTNTNSAEDARAYVRQSVERGCDYVKILIEDGEVLGKPNLPVLSQAAIDAAVSEGHAYGKMVIAHALRQELAKLAVASGVDGLAHLFVDGPANGRFARQIARSRAFVVPCLVLDWSITGGNEAALARDPRVMTKLSAAERRTISESMNTFPSGRFDDVLASVASLREAGVDLLVGTDCNAASSRIMPGLPAHGASLHHELQLFVRAGCSPIEALRAATSLPAERFDLWDRGRIAPGLRADLVLVDGDPTRDISSTISIKNVWRAGAPVEGAAVA